MNKSLINKGITVIGAPTTMCGPIVVVGTARGGTSLVAGALSKLGVFMGDQACPPVFEDVRLSAAMENCDFIQAKQISAEYSSKFTKWGWKRPSSINSLDDVARTLEPSCYVFIYKDILSIAQRNNISMRHEILPSMERALSEYRNSLDFLYRNRPYVLLASYEKAVSYPVEFTTALVDFSGLISDQKLISEAAAFINRAPSGYLDSTRITKAEGRVCGVEGRTVYGWARYAHLDRSALVDIFVNSQKIGSTLADKHHPRTGLISGQPCAFIFDLPDGIGSSSGDQLSARVVDEVNDLENSPWTLSA